MVAPQQRLRPIRLLGALALLLIAGVARAQDVADIVALGPYEGGVLAPLRLPLALPVPSEGASRTLPSGQGTMIVHFFATWCEPCREELPALAAIADPSTEIVLVSVAESTARVARFFETTPQAGSVVLDRDRSAARAWGITALPSSILFVDGVPRLIAEGPVAWTAPETRSRLAFVTASTRRESPSPTQTAP